MLAGMETIWERLLRLEGLMGDIPDHEDRSVQDRLELAMDITEKATAQYVELAAESGRKWQVVEEVISVLKKAVTNAAGGVGSSKLKVPEPKTFAGARSSKDLENFLWDMEHYFSVAKTSVDGQVDIEVMYLSGDAKLWWRTRTKEDLNAGRPKVETEMRIEGAISAQQYTSCPHSLALPHANSSTVSLFS